MVRENDCYGVGRRSVLQKAGGLATAGLIAGCTGTSDGGGDSGDGGDETDDLQTEFTFATPSDSTTAYAMATAMSPIIQSASPLTMRARPTAGSTPAMIEMLEGAAALSDGQDLAGIDAMKGEGDFSDVDASHQLTAIHSYYWLYFGFLVPTSSKFEYVSDLAGEPVTVGPTGPSFHNYVKGALTKAIPESELNLKYTGFSNWGSAMSSDQIVMAPFLNVAGTTPSYVQQVLAQNDVRMLAWKDENVQKIQGEQRMTGAYYGNDNPEYEKVSEFTSSDETFQVSVQYLWYASEKVNAATVNTLLSALAEERDRLKTAHSAFGLWTDLEFWPQHFRSEVPVHPGAAQFYRDNGLWNDDWSAAEF